MVGGAGAQRLAEVVGEFRPQADEDLQFVQRHQRLRALIVKLVQSLLELSQCPRRALHAELAQDFAQQSPQHPRCWAAQVHVGRARRGMSSPALSLATSCGFEPVMFHSATVPSSSPTANRPSSPDNAGEAKPLNAPPILANSFPVSTSHNPI